MKKTIKYGGLAASLVAATIPMGGAYADTEVATGYNSETCEVVTGTASDEAAKSSTSLQAQADAYKASATCKKNEAAVLAGQIKIAADEAQVYATDNGAADYAKISENIADAEAEFKEAYEVSDSSNDSLMIALGKGSDAEDTPWAKAVEALGAGLYTDEGILLNILGDKINSYGQDDIVSDFAEVRELEEIDEKIAERDALVSEVAKLDAKAAELQNAADKAGVAEEAAATAEGKAADAKDAINDVRKDLIDAEGVVDAETLEKLAAQLEKAKDGELDEAELEAIVEEAGVAAKEAEAAGEVATKAEAAAKEAEDKLKEATEKAEADATKAGDAKTARDNAKTAADAADEAVATAEAGVTSAEEEANKKAEAVNETLAKQAEAKKAVAEAEAKVTEAKEAGKTDDEITALEAELDLDGLKSAVEQADTDLASAKEAAETADKAVADAKKTLEEKVAAQTEAHNDLSAKEGELTTAENDAQAAKEAVEAATAEKEAADKAVEEAKKAKEEADEAASEASAAKAAVEGLAGGIADANEAVKEANAAQAEADAAKKAADDALEGKTPEEGGEQPIDEPGEKPTDEPGTDTPTTELDTDGKPYDYSVLNGNGAVYTADGSTLSFRFKAPYDKFEFIVLDGQQLELKSGLYTVKEGSIIVTLSNALLDQLSEGEHVLSVYADGKLSEAAKFTVKSAEVAAVTPDTGAFTGEGSSAVASLVGAIMTATIAGAAVVLRKRSA